VVLIDGLPSFERHKAFELDSYNNKDQTINLPIQPSPDIYSFPESKMSELI
jgi:hypothetical protein